MQDIIVIVGPTGIGKTKLSIELAKKLDAEVKYLEVSSKSVEEAVVGENVGIFLKNITKEQVEVGQQLVK